MSALSQYASPRVVEVWCEEGIEDPTDLAWWWSSLAAVREWARVHIAEDLQEEATRAWAAARRRSTEVRSGSVRPSCPPEHLTTIPGSEVPALAVRRPLRPPPLRPPAVDLPPLRPKLREIPEVRVVQQRTQKDDQIVQQLVAEYIRIGSAGLR